MDPITNIEPENNKVLWEVYIMNLDQPTLIQFEAERKKNSFVPPAGSNSFYTIGTGRINLSTIRSDRDDYRFDLFTDKGNVFTGAGNFIISGDIVDINKPYKDLVVIKDTSLSINNMITLSKGSMNVYGSLKLMKGSRLVIRDGAVVTLYPDSVFEVNEDINILVEKGSSLIIYGQINIKLSSVDTLLNAQGVTIDSAAVMNVEGINSLNRLYSLTDYDSALRERVINIHTQGEKNYTEGRIGYTWTGGTPTNSSQIIRMSVLWGNAILGDFKLSILGMPSEPIPNLQMISDLLIKKDTTLHITENYKDNEYIRPELYLGLVIGNNDIPGTCVVEGNIIVDGVNSLITIDRGASLHIRPGGKIELRNGAVIRSTHNSDNDRIFFIDGTLIMDDIDQINSFKRDNIVFGENGKIIILNPDRGEKRLLWTTPNGIEDTDLYRLFKDRIDHIEYHISNNTGIGIDKYYEFYARQMTNWYGGRRIEKAIHDGILVWHSGGFIELYHDITPWVDTDCNLLHASRLFKTFGSYDADKLQEAVNRLTYAGAGNILFRFIKDDEVAEVILILEGIHMENILNRPMTNMYELTTDNDGKLFMKNNVTEATLSNIVHEDSRSFDIVDNHLEFPLP